MLDFDIIILANVNPAGRVARRRAEADNHAMHMRRLGHLAVPAEGAIGKVDMNAKAIDKRLPDKSHLFALRDRIGGHQCGTNSCTLHHFGRLEIPAGHVVDLTRGLVGLVRFIYINRKQILLLLFGLQRITHKRRVADDVIRRGADGTPVEAQGVVFGDMRLGAEGKEVEIVVNNRCRLALHAGLGDPHRGARHHDGKVVDLDPVKAIDRDTNRREGLAEDGHIGRVDSCGAHHLVLQAAQREVGLGQEVTRAAGGVEEGHSGYALLKGQQLPTAATRFSDGFEVVKLVAQPIEEKRVDDAVNVLHRGVVHAARTTRFGVEGTLKHGAEDGGRDAAPVESLRGIDHQRMNGFGAEHRYLPGVGLRGRDVEKSAVDIGQLGERTFIGVALVMRRVEDTEETDQFETEDLGHFDQRLEVAKEESPLAEEPRVVRIEAEDDAHAEHIEVAERLGRCGVDVVRQEQVVDLPDQLAGTDGQRFLLLADALHLGIDEEVEAVELLGEVGQGDDAWRRFGCLHVVDADTSKVADDDPSGSLGVGEHGVVARRLAEGGQQRAVALALRRVKVYAEALLLDQYVGRRDEGVHKRLVSELDGALEADQLKGVGCAEHLAKHFEPEGLRVALLVALSGPSLGEGAGGVWVV